MPTKKKKTRPRSFSAADAIEKQRTELVRKIANLFPKSRWTRKEARRVSDELLQSFSDFLRTGRVSHLKDMAMVQLKNAGRKGTPLRSGLAFLSSVIKEITGVLVRSPHLDQRALELGVARTIQAFDYLNNLALDSQLRQTSATEELLRRISFHDGIFRNPSVAIFAAEAKGKIVLWSKGAENMSGISRKKAIGKRLPGVLALKDSETAPISEGALSRAFSQIAKRSGLSPTKRHFVASGSVSKISDDAGHFLGTAAIAFDMTETRRAKKRAEELAQVIENCNDAIIHADADGKIVYFNKGAERLTGLSRKEAVGQLMDNMTKGRTDVDAAAIRQILKKRGAWTGEVTGVRKDGSEFNALLSLTAEYSDDGSYCGALAVAADITELRQAEQKAKESQAIFKTIIDTIDDPVVMTDKHGRLVLVNKACEKLSGYSQREILTKGYPYATLSPSERKDVEAYRRKVIDSPGSRKLQRIMPTKKGERKEVEWKSTALRDKQGNTFGIVSVGRDMTERIKRENELRLLLDLSASLGKTVELGEILSEALERTMKAFGADAGLTASLDKNTGYLHLLAHRGMETELVARLNKRKLGESLTARVISTGKPVVVEDLRKLKGKFPPYPETLRAGYLSFMSLPLLFKGTVFGVFEMASRQLKQFKKSDLDLGMSLAGIVSSALLKAMLHREIATRQNELVELSKKLTSAEEDERKRISAELHDSTGQLLATAKMKLELITEQVAQSQPETGEVLEETVALLSRALDEVRNISHGLHPSLLDELGFVSAVRWLARKTSQLSGIDVRLRVKGFKKRLPASIETPLFRIAQEALNNLARHSRASKATVALSASDSNVKMAIRDDGIGFDLAKEYKNPAGLGLRTLRQRVRWLGGEFKLESGPGKGTSLEVQIPLEEPNEKG